MFILVLDVETTGLDPETDRIVEVAAVSVREQVVDETTGLTQWRVEEGWRSFVKPGRPIPPEASAIHHIVDADVVDAPSLAEALDYILTPAWPTMVDIVAAHNAAFDRGFLPMLKDRRWIDTWRCARHVWPDAPAHGNQVLRYWLGIDLPRDGAHRALQDAEVTAYLLCRLLEEHSVDELLRLSTKAVLLRKVGFGKHFGQPWADVPSSYLDWAAKQDFDPDVKFTVRTEIARRAAA